MHTKPLIIFAAAALLPLASLAGEGAKGKSNPMGASFDTLDANRDGRISQAEAAVDANLVFTSADKNGDGYLDKTEYRNRDQSGRSMPQPQSLPGSPSETDRTLPETPPSSEPPADTERPRL